ncbi:S-adenosyl-L-methionine-dependent methyltransferase [Chaetomidium leptoderma]|uniref:S-adenosyl-L-methionine-dependent methyltransferase n=1 Tax=Chaetomidium leptoderma TaxID=669021 RepID=A0AAN6VIS5_9PEZI|nr:S-adenosyl-L-methionine-dependent methyltransferase [Chaetomidium leptoderma]
MAQNNQQLTALSSNGSAGRASVISAAQAIIHAAQSAQDLYVHFAVNKCEIIVMRLFLKWDAIQEIPLQGSISFSELAVKIGAEEGLVARLSRMLVASGMLTLAGSDRVAHTHRSRMIAEDALFRSTAKLILYEDFPQPAGTPEYFDHYGRREPAGKTHTPYSFRKGQPDKPVFELIHAQPGLLQIFMEAMSRTQDFLATSYDASCIARDDDDQHHHHDADDVDDDDDEVARAVVVVPGDRRRKRPLLVDVGGGAGRTLKAILSQTPGLAPERCVLQDRPEVIERSKGDQDPGLRGAKAYLMRRCLHDYGDSECVGMLRQIKEAMDSNSTLLIMEMVLLPDSPPFCYAMDMAMMGIAGKERTLDDWRALTEEAGLKISKTVPAPGIGLSVLECVKA